MGQSPPLRVQLSGQLHVLVAEPHVGLLKLHGIGLQLLVLRHRPDNYKKKNNNKNNNNKQCLAGGMYFHERGMHKANAAYQICGLSGYLVLGGKYCHVGGGGGGGGGAVWEHAP